LKAVDILKFFITTADKNDLAMMFSHVRLTTFI